MVGNQYSTSVKILINRQRIRTFYVNKRKSKNELYYHLIDYFDIFKPLG